MKVEGITWHAIVLEAEPFAAMRAMLVNTLSLEPMMETDGWSLFGMPNGTILDLISPAAVPSWGMNEGVIFGFRVDDIEVASAELADAGCELLGDTNFVEQLNYSWRHYRGPDGRVYGINQQR